MKRTLLICLLIFSVSLANAQKIYFVYLQTENGDPFFVRINDNLYSSTPSGYLILAKLKDSTYSFKLGFPGKDADLDFTTTINKRDHGYLIKNFGEKGWGLFDLQSLSIQMSSTPTKSSAEIKNSNIQVDPFTDLLSKATDDPSLKQSPIWVKESEKKPQVIETVAKEEKKPEATDAIVKEEKRTETTTQPPGKPVEEKTASPVTIEQKNDSLEKKPMGQSEEVYKKSLVSRISGTATSEGVESVFIDQYSDGHKDTVRILIPAEKEAIVAKGEAKTDSTKEDKKFLDILDTAQVINKPVQQTKKEEPRKWWPFSKSKDSETSEARSRTKKEDSQKSQVAKDKTARMDKEQGEVKKGDSKKWGLFTKKKNDSGGIKGCQVVAGNDDFLKLRRRMAAKTNDDGMLVEARKYFKEKCFTTEQIKNLSSMFLSSAGKYNFFEAAHNYVSDHEKFASLQSELRDEQYLNRFKALIDN